MPKPERLELEAAKPTERELKALKAVHQDVEANRALAFFSKRSGKPEQWWITLFVLHVWAGKAYPKFLSPRPEEFTAEQALRIAENVEKVAADIRKLRLQSWHGALPIPEILGRHSSEEMKTAFENVPYFLEHYAANLGAKARFTLALQAQERREQQSMGKPRHYYEELLQKRVCELTGRKYRDKTAAILRVIDALAGVCPIDSESLRKREKRQRERRPAAS